MIRKNISRDLRWGAGWGLFGGVVWGVFAAVVIILRDGIPESAPERVTPLTLLTLYPLGGIGAGLVVGLLRPFARERSGAMLVGMVAALPFAAGFMYLKSGSISGWGGAEWFAVIAGSMLLGAMGGYKLWDQHNFDPEAYVKTHKRMED